jgi:hypothetical protein
MNKRLLLVTSAAVAIATSAFAQSAPTTATSSPSASQRQPEPTSTTAPSNSTQTPNPSSNNSAQTKAPRSSGQNAAGQSSNSGAGTSTSQAPASNNSPSHAQTNSPSNTINSRSNAQTQTANPPRAGNEKQSRTGNGSTNDAQQPNQQDRERSASTHVNASVNINDQQRARISQSVARLKVQPLNNLNFSLSVGTSVPRNVRLQRLPAAAVKVIPQYRGYNFVLARDEIVIVEPSSYKIVAVLPYSGRSTAAAPVRREQRKVTFSDRDREVVRKHAKARPAERQSTGSTVRTEIRMGERVPEGVEIETFPEDLYRESPVLREYRYIHRDTRTYIVEPQERRVIEEID